MIPTNVFIAAMATLVILMNGTMLTFPKGRPAEILMKIFCGVAAYFWIMAIFKTPSVGAYVTAGVFALIAFLIGPLKSKEPEAIPNVADTQSPTFQIATDNNFPFIGYTGKIRYRPSTDKNSYIGLLDENGESILIYSETNFEENEKFVITHVKNGKIFVDKIEK